MRVDPLGQRITEKIHQVGRRGTPSYHLIVYLVKVDLAHFIYYVLAFKRNKTKTCECETVRRECSERREKRKTE